MLFDRWIRPQHLRLRQFAMLLLGSITLSGCISARDPAPMVIQQTPTLPPTKQPGTSADQQAARDVVMQFSTAVTRGDDLVALLMLTPSAQRAVAAGTLNEFLGSAAPPQSIDVQQVRLDNDSGIAECRVRYPNSDRLIQLRLVRIDGTWKIDGLSAAPSSTSTNAAAQSDGVRSDPIIAYALLGMDRIC